MTASCGSSSPAPGGRTVRARRTQAHGSRRPALGAERCEGANPGLGKVHALRLPTSPTHPVLQVIAAATDLTLKEVLDEQRQRIRPGAKPPKLRDRSFDTATHRLPLQAVACDRGNYRDSRATIAEGLLPFSCCASASRVPARPPSRRPVRWRRTCTSAPLTEIASAAGRLHSTPDPQRCGCADKESPPFMTLQVQIGKGDCLASCRCSATTVAVLRRLGDCAQRDAAKNHKDRE